MIDDIIFNTISAYSQASVIAVVCRDVLYRHFTGTKFKVESHSDYREISVSWFDGSSEQSVTNKLRPLTLCGHFIFYKDGSVEPISNRDIFNNGLPADGFTDKIKESRGDIFRIIRTQSYLALSVNRQYTSGFVMDKVVPAFIGCHGIVPHMSFTRMDKDYEVTRRINYPEFTTLNGDKLESSYARRDTWRRFLRGYQDEEIKSIASLFTAREPLAGGADEF